MSELTSSDRSITDPWQKYLGWLLIALLLGYVTNNFLEIYLGFNKPNSITNILTLSGVSGLVVYMVFIFLAVLKVKRSRENSFRKESLELHSYNVFFLRGCFFAVLFVGCVDFTLALVRSLDILKYIVGDSTSRALGLGNVVGPYIHVPLILLGFFVARFSRTLGWTWLALLIVFAELIIVLSRYLFSYEQSFMADLVRYWYAALFLFASAYTLFDEGHVRVDVLYQGFSIRTKAFINAWGSLVLGILTMVVVIVIGFNGKTSIINSPLLVFEITNQGINGMYIKYQMAFFLGIFAATMLVQFVVQFFDSVADIYSEPGKRDTSIKIGN